MYFELETGRIVRDMDVKLAYEIYTGNKANVDSCMFRRWCNDCHMTRIPESEITVERLIKGDAFVLATKLYRDQNRCSLREARETCEKIRDELIRKEQRK